MYNLYIEMEIRNLVMETAIRQSILNNIDLNRNIPAWIAAVKKECAEFDQSLVNKIFLEFALKCAV